MRTFNGNVTWVFLNYVYIYHHIWSVRSNGNIALHVNILVLLGSIASSTNNWRHAEGPRTAKPTATQRQKSEISNRALRLSHTAYLWLSFVPSYTSIVSINSIDHLVFVIDKQNVVFKQNSILQGFVRAERLMWRPHPSVRHLVSATKPFVVFSLYVLDCVWNVMAHGDAREEKWRGNWRMEWVTGKGHVTAEHRLARAVQTLQADVHSSAASSRLNWRPCRFKWTRPFFWKTKSGFCVCAITFQKQSTRFL
jgi:hypothetical protein